MKLGLLVIASAFACGGDDGDGGEGRVDAFVGTWTFGPGSTYVSDCSEDGFDRSNPLSTSFQLIAGTVSDLTEPGPPFWTCAPILLDVTGDIASAPSGQMCSAGTGTDAFDETIASFSFTLDAAGTTLTIAGMLASETRATPPVTCDHTITGTATKN